MENYYKYYIRTDEKSRIVSGFSTAFAEPIESDVCINENGDYQFRIFEDGEENPALATFDGIPLYKWNGQEVVKRTEEEIQLDRKEIPLPEPTQLERVQAQADYTAMMTDTLLEV